MPSTTASSPGAPGRAGSSVDRDVVLRRIQLIREYAAVLKELLNAPEDTFVRDRDVYLKAERCLEVVVQAMLDIGNHIISDRQLRRPARYDEIFEILGENGVIGRGLAARLRGLAGLRNMLVHATARGCGRHWSRASTSSKST